MSDETMTCTTCEGAVRRSAFDNTLVHVEHGPAQQFPNDHEPVVTAKAKAPEITAVWKDCDGEYWLEVEGRYYPVDMANDATGQPGHDRAYADTFGPLVQVLP